MQAHVVMLGLWMQCARSALTGPGSFMVKDVAACLPDHSSRLLPCTKGLSSTGSRSATRNGEGSVEMPVCFAFIFVLPDQKISSTPVSSSSCDVWIEGFFRPVPAFIKTASTLHALFMFAAATTRNEM